MLFRSVFLKTIALGVSLTLVYVASKPTTSTPLDRPIHLPDTLALPGWEAESTQAVSPPNAKYNRVLSGQRYVYRQHDRVFQVTVRDVVETEGDVGQLMVNFQEPSMKLPDSFHDRQSDRGFYRLFTQGNQAHLQSCLNLNGYTTVTPTQFRQNAYVQALRPQQWLGWLLSQHSLLERRCLWIQISTPVQQDVQQTYTMLEQSWTTLVSSWRSF